MKETYLILICVYLLIQSSFGGVLKKVECSSDPLVCADPICKLTPIRRGVKEGVYGCTPVKAAHKFWIRITQYKKTNANVYMPGYYDITQDLCAFLNHDTIVYGFFKNAIEQLEPEALETYEKALHPCPFTDTWRVTRMHVEVSRNRDLANMDEFKSRIWIFNEYNQTFYELTTYYTTRRGF